MVYQHNILKAYWQVTAGVIPGIPNPELSRRFNLTSSDYESEKRSEIIEAKRAEASSYAESLQNPSVLNWVTLEWVWV